MNLDQSKYSQTVDHLLIKKFFYDNIPISNEVVSIEEEYRISNRIADIYVVLKDGKKVVIEIQHSKISISELSQRTREYNLKGIHVLWILDGNGPFEKNAQNEKGVNCTSIEKFLQLIYKGRVYYVNASENGILSPVYSLYFAGFYEKKKSTFGFDYYKKSKKRASAIYNEISSHQLLLFRNKGFLLARFFDKNTKIQCMEGVMKFLNGFIRYRDANPKRAYETFPHGLPLGILINKFFPQYDVYLLFEVLRNLKFLTIRDAPFIFEENSWFKKFLL